MKILRDLDGIIQWGMFFNNGYHRVVFACAVLLALAGCAPADAATIPAEPQTKPTAPESMPPPTNTPFIPTLPTFTPEPTSTPEPTNTPEPTEIPRVRLSADIDNPASVPWEDLMAGRIEPAEPVAFADDAQFKIKSYEDRNSERSRRCHY